MHKLLRISVFTGFLFILSACNASPELSSVVNSGSIQTASTLTYSWDDINIAGGTVEHTFTLTNAGTDQLVLKGASTSCMCTTAEIQLPDGTMSPLFGMHTSDTGWAYAVQPGESFDVRVVFDPMAHGPTAVGPIQRSVSIVSSAVPDGMNTKNQQYETRGSVTELRVSGMVLSEDEYLTKHSN